jgi:hypothetical protein
MMETALQMELMGSEPAQQEPNRAELGVCESYVSQMLQWCQSQYLSLPLLYPHDGIFAIERIQRNCMDFFSNATMIQEELKRSKL